MAADIRTTTRFFLKAFAFLSAVCCTFGAARSSNAPREVLVIPSSSAAPYQAAETSLRNQLKSAGVQVSSRAMTDISGADLKALSSSATTILVALGTESAQRLKTASATPSFVYCMVADPEGAGLSDAVSIDGVTTDVSSADQVAVIREAFPNARRLATLFRSNEAKSRDRFEDARRAMPAGMSLIGVDLANEESVNSALKAMLGTKPDVIWTLADSKVYDTGTIRALLKASLAAGVPVFGFSSQVVRAGAPVGVGIRPDDQGEQAARLVLDRVNGTGGGGPTAGDHGITAPRVRISLNSTVVDRLGLNLPRSLVDRADEVFKGGE